MEALLGRPGRQEVAGSSEPLEHLPASQERLGHRAPHPVPVCTTAPGPKSWAPGCLCAEITYFLLKEIIGQNMIRVSL